MCSGFILSDILRAKNKFPNNSSICFKLSKLISALFGSEMPLSIFGIQESSGCEGTLIELDHLSLNAVFEYMSKV